MKLISEVFSSYFVSVLVVWQGPRAILGKQDTTVVGSGCYTAAVKRIYHPADVKE